MSRARKGSKSPKDASDNDANDIEACPICLHTLVDRTLVPTCAHEFCFDCILEWTGQSRKCPLCNQAIGEYLIHRIRGRYDYQKYYITALLENDADSQPGPSRRPRRERAHREEADRLEQSIEKRRAVYEWHLYAKHVASNAYTKYRPYPTPAQFAASPELIRRTTMFLRRELLVWVNLDVEFLTTFTISLMKSIDIRSAVNLIAEFLDLDGGKENAEHFAHEIYTYVRSPYQDLFVYDTVVQYDDPPERDYRWRRPTSRQRSRSRSPRRRSPSPSRIPYRRSSSAPRRGRSRSRASRSPSELSWSPSGRTYSSTRRSRSPRRTRHRTEGKQKEKVQTGIVSSQRRSASPRRRSTSPQSPVQKPSSSAVLTPIPPRPPRPPRSALEALHAHLGVSNGKGKEKALPPTAVAHSAESLATPENLQIRHADLRARLQALKAENPQIIGDTPTKQDGDVQEKRLKLRARLAAEKRKCI